MKFNKKASAGIQLSLILLSIFAFSFLSSDRIIVSASEPTACCEQVSGGGTCLNTNATLCDPDYLSAPTFCEYTSYCETGTCYNSGTGICMGNTARRTCEEYDGAVWDNRSINEVPQCQLGCCIIADQAAFVTYTRCKNMSSSYGVPNNYRTDITNELDCIATAQAQDMGACVYEQDYERKCDYITRAECGAVSAPEYDTDGNVAIYTEKTFYNNFFCSDDELLTTCAKESTTQCYQGDVYYVDSCGNREDKAEDCNYLLGTRCAEESGFFSGAQHVCRATDCSFDVDGIAGDESLRNGEAFCTNPGLGGENNFGDTNVMGNGTDLVGSRYFRGVCMDGEVIIEPCSDFRNEICIEGSVAVDGGADFSTARCRVNRWQDCVLQEDQEGCEDISKRDCRWFPPFPGAILAGINEDGSSINEGLCAPFYSPGLDFWTEGSSEEICSLGNARCERTTGEGLLGKDYWDIPTELTLDNIDEIQRVESGEATEGQIECGDVLWAYKANQVCVSLGDCGGYMNYVSEPSHRGYNYVNMTWDDKEEEWNSIETELDFGYSNFFPLLILGLTGRLIDVPGQTTGAIDEEEEGIPNTISLSAFLKTAPYGTIFSLMPTITGNNFDINNVPYVGLDLGGGENSNTGTATNSDTGKIGSNEKEESVNMDEETNSGIGGEILGAVTSASIAAVAGYFVGRFAVGLIPGADDTQAQSAGLSLGAAAATWQIAKALGAGSVLTPVVSLGIGALVFIATYADTTTMSYEFQCLPWQPPVGGDNCEVCNDDDIPCSEYRCKSLGLTCEIVNQGTTEERCVNIDPNDATPPVIFPNEDIGILNEGLEYQDVVSSPPEPGFKIIHEGGEDDCLPRFTPIQFGIKTRDPAEADLEIAERGELAQCKIDYKHTETFEEMMSYMGGSNLYKYSHTERFTLPNVEDLESAGFELVNGEEMTFFIRCQDRSGNTNDAEFAVRFCVDDSLDTTAPKVETTSMASGSCVAADSQNTKEVIFYTNEQSICKWSDQDQAFGSMPNTMIDSTTASLNSLFAHTANLTGVTLEETNYYVRCQDDEEIPNTMSESYPFSLRGSTGLLLKNLQPDGTEGIFGAIDPMPVELFVETAMGCDNGISTCYYSINDYDESGNGYAAFFDTNNEDGVSTQKLNLGSGEHNIYVRCVDAGGNMVEENSTIQVDIDPDMPIIARVYEEAGMLKIVTIRESDCTYTFDNCDFEFDEGTVMPYPDSTVHVAEWNSDKTYYIKCQDEYIGAGLDCSMVVRPTDEFL